MQKKKIYKLQNIQDLPDTLKYFFQEPIKSLLYINVGLFLSCDLNNLGTQHRLGLFFSFYSNNYPL